MKVGIRSLGGVLFFLFFLILGFQNCVPTSTESKTQNSIDDRSRPQPSVVILEGGGDGYEGKTYLELASSACADGSDVKARLKVLENQSFLLREDCKDLDSALPLQDLQKDEGFTVLYQNRRFQLESLTGSGKGLMTLDLSLGHYAPVVSEIDLGQASALQAIPWGDEHILVAKGQGPHYAVMTHYDLLLFKKKNQGLELVDQLNYAFSRSGFYMDPIVNMSPLSEDRALLFVKKSGGFQSFLVERNGSNLETIVEGPSLVSHSQGLGGHPVDKNRIILTLPDSNQINYQVLQVDEEQNFTLGEPLSQPTESLLLASNDLNNPAFLATSSIDKWLVVKSNVGLENSYSGMFQLEINGIELMASDYQTLAGFGNRSRNPMAVGSEDLGAILIQSSGSYYDEDYSWASFVDGQYKYQGVLGFGDLTQEWVGLTNLVGSQNLMIKDLALARITSGGDDRIVLMEPRQGKQVFYNVYLPKTWQAGTARLFSFQNQLVFVEARKGKGRIVFLSIPDTEDLP